MPSRFGDVDLSLGWALFYDGACVSIACLARVSPGYNVVAARWGLSYGEKIRAIVLSAFIDIAPLLWGAGILRYCKQLGRSCTTYFN